MRGRGKWLLLPFVLPFGVAWVAACMFGVLIPTILVAMALTAIGEGDLGDRAVEWASSVMGFETAPWTWLRGEA